MDAAGSFEMSENLYQMNSVYSIALFYTIYSSGGKQL